MHGYPEYLDPVGENYGQVTIGDYLQLLGLDTHSAYPEDVGAWLADAINENVLCTIPFHHSPQLTGGNRREPEDDDLQELLRDEWLRLLWDDASVLCHFAGHIHLREYTVPYEIANEEPTSGNYIALNDGADGYLVEDESADADRVMQFGTGYRANRSYDDEWFTDYIAEEHQFYSMTLTTSDLEVRELDGDGNVYESHTFSHDGDSDVSVSTAEAINIGETSATLNGSLDDLGGASSADCYFEYRESGTSTWSTTTGQTLSSTGSFNQDISGLSSGTDYDFRAVADASDGDTDTGSSVTFTTTTSDTDVAVSTNSASNIGESSATLNGSLDDLGGADSADVYFEWGPSGDLANATEPQTLTATGTFSEELTGLESNTEYEYRAVAEASDGDTDSGSSVTFTTSTGDTPPAIDSYTVTEAGTPNPHAEITADWTVSDADSDLDHVTVEIFDSGGALVDSTQTSVSGSTASGTDEFQIKHVEDQTFDVTLTVTDMNGATASQTETVTE